MGVCSPRRQAGFTYLGLIILVFIVGLVGAATLKVGALLQRAQLETELLEIGAQFSAALKSYADATPRGQPTQPLTLQELLRDTRFPNPRRHLRKIFVDPITGRPEWGIVSAGEGGRIMGVHSLSQAQPLKLAGFDERFSNFENREHHADWKFMALGQGAAPASRPAPGAPEPPITMTPPPEQPAGPEAAPVEAQAPMRELVPRPRNEPEPEPPQEEPPAEPPADDRNQDRDEDRDDDKDADKDADKQEEREAGRNRPKEPPPATDSGR